MGEGEGITQARGWIGLRSLEVGFHDNSSKHSQGDEVSFIVSFPICFFSPMSLHPTIFTDVVFTAPLQSFTNLITSI